MSANITNMKFSVFGRGYEDTRSDSGDGAVEDFNRYAMGASSAVFDSTGQYLWVGIFGNGHTAGLYKYDLEDDFNELMEFVRWARFECMGAFAYSEEEGTYSAEHYQDDVPEEVKQERLDRLMALQQEISAEIQAEKVGTTMKVIIDRKEGEYYIGRTEFSSPEVDPEVLIPVAERTLRVGTFYEATITGAEEFDLYASVKNNKR